jgi:hypothetical protein
MSDTKHTPPAADDAAVEREVQLGRKFSLSEALGQMGGQGLLKGESPIAPLGFPIVMAQCSLLRNYTLFHNGLGGVWGNVV